MKVIKFGGSSVANAGNIEKVIEIVKTAVETNSCVVVLSAMQGTTDALIEIGKLAELGDESFRSKIDKISEKHAQALALLVGQKPDELIELIKNFVSDLKSICEGVFSA